MATAPNQINAILAQPSLVALPRAGKNRRSKWLKWALAIG